LRLRLRSLTLFADSRRKRALDSPLQSTAASTFSLLRPPLHHAACRRYPLSPSLHATFSHSSAGSRVFPTLSLSHRNNIFVPLFPNKYERQLPPLSTFPLPSQPKFPIFSRNCLKYSPFLPVSHTVCGNLPQTIRLPDYRFGFTFPSFAMQILHA
jgi:hypothetical protein